jgi:hypothetical protein
LGGPNKSEERTDMKKSLRILTFLFVMSFAFGVVQGFSQIMSGEKEEVWKLEEAFYESFKNGDLTGHLALLHEDGQLWEPYVPYPLTKAGYENYYGGQVKFKIDSYRLGWPAINIVGNTAIVYFDVKIEGYLRPDLLSARVIHIWTKQDKKWLLTGGMTYRR